MPDLLSKSAEVGATDSTLPDDLLPLLSAAAGFAAVPADILRKVAAEMRHESFAAGAVVIGEGEAGDRLYLIVGGSAEASIKNRAGSPVPVANLGRGEIFGELALLSEGSRRQATVTALAPLQTYSLSRASFRHFLDAQPAARAAFAELAEKLLVAKFLKQASPFATIEPGELRNLAARLGRHTAAAGEIFIRQGEPGGTCYLLRAGKVEVLLRNAEGEERRIATLEAGAIFGEAALLTAAPRNASVRALEPCDLLVLQREDLMAAMGADQQTGRRIIELLHLRDRPRRVDGVLAVQRTNSEGETMTILKNPSQGTYYRLSSQGSFIWERLTGDNTLRDLTLDYFLAFKALAPHAVAEIIGGLTAAGFVETGALREDVHAEAAAALPAWQRLALLSRRVLEFRVTLNNVDGFLTRVYDGGLRHIFTWPGHLLLGSLALAGLVTFILGSGRTAHALPPLGAGWLAISLVVAFTVIIGFHEAGHAFATKAFGRHVPRIGVGWYWFGPIAFVDTSDMWLEGRWPRIAVNLAGIYVNLVLAGITSLVAWLYPDPLVATLCFQFSLFSYLLVLFNLNPLLEYDGYFVLMDLLNRPNLRSRALAWLGRDFVPALRKPGGLRGHWIELAYGVGSILYVGVMAVLTVVLYRLVAEDWVARVAPAPAAAAFAWVLAALVVLLSFALVVGDLKGRK